MSAASWPGVAAGRARLTTGALLAGWLGAAIAIGAFAAVASYLVHPVIAPGVCGAVALAAITLARPEYGIAAWFVMVPLSRLGLLGDPPWLLSAGWAAVLFCIAFARAVRDREPFPPFSIAVLAVVGVTLALVWITPTTSDALPPMRTTLTGAWLFFAVATLVRGRHAVAVVLGAASTAAGIAGIAAATERRSGATEDGFITATGELVARVSAGFGQPNQLAGFLVVLVPLAVAGMVLTRRRALFAAAALLAVAGIYLTFSRAALIGLAVIPFAFAGVRRGLVLAPLGALGLMLFAPALLRERFATLSAEGSEIATRSDFWETALSIWQGAPLFGVGPGGFADAYAVARVPGKEFLPTTLFEPPPHAHNLVLQLLAEQGVVGALAFGTLAGLAGLALTRLRRHPAPWIRITSRALLASAAAFLVHNMFDVTLLEGTGEYMWALLGLVAALVTTAGEPRGWGGPPAARSASARV